MRLTQLIFSGFLLVLSSAFGAGWEDLEFDTASSIPPHVMEAFNKLSSSEKYVFSTHINPFYIQGDFNGDGKLDAAIFLKEKVSEKVGIAIVDNDSASISILGAGNKFGNGGDDFSWLDAWHAYPNAVASQGVGEASPPKLKGDSIMVIKTESASALVYWNGENYEWYQQGD